MKACLNIVTETRRCKENLNLYYIKQTEKILKDVPST